jgi:hypothetical protein
MQSWERKKIDRDKEQTVPGQNTRGYYLKFLINENGTVPVLHADTVGNETGY